MSGGGGGEKSAPSPRPSPPSTGEREKRWDGSPLDGRTILLVGEQGQGDMMQFIRYARLVKERGGKVPCKDELNNDATMSQDGWHALRYSEGREGLANEPRPSEYLRACHPEIVQVILARP